MESPIKYHLAEDGVGIWVQSGDKALTPISRSDHLLVKSFVAAEEIFNRGVKRGDTILVTGDRPRFALARTLPEDSPGPDLIRLGDGRVRLSGRAPDGRSEIAVWLDDCPGVATYFYPGRTEYSLSSPQLPGLDMRLTVAQAQDWGLVARLVVTNSGMEMAKLTVAWAYGGVRRHGRTWSPAYFPADAECDGQTIERVGAGDAALMRAETIPDWVGAVTQPRRPPVFLGHKAGFALALDVAAGESQECWLIAGHAGSAEHLQSLLGAADPELLMGESNRYYADMLAQVAISTPRPILDAAFRTAIWNLDSTYTAPAWIEGVHWWSAWWVNLFQISAAISLGQYKRARRALQFFSQAGYGLILASGQAVGWPPPDVLYYYPYDGLFYYIYQLGQYVDHTGDLELVAQMWPSLVATLERVLADRDPDGDGLLSWRLGCNAFLYQADQLGMPGGAASPSLMAAGMIERLAGLARRLGWADEAGRWQAQAERIYARLPRLWNHGEGAFYNHIDWQGLAHNAHYYTDLVFPALYTSENLFRSTDGPALPEEAIWQSLAHLRRTLVYHTTHADPRLNLTLMRVGDLKPSMFGNDNVLPAQMAETARACFGVGDHDLGCGLLEAVALAGTLYTEAPGNFPERLDDAGKGEFNYLFGHPIAAFAYNLVAGLFGLNLAGDGQTLDWQPGFPASWDHAELKLPYAHVCFSRTISGERVTSRYWAQHGGRNLAFSIFLEPCHIRAVRCNGQPVAYSLAPGLGKTRLTLTPPPAAAYDLEIVCEPFSLLVDGPSQVVAGEIVTWSLQRSDVAPVLIERVADPQGLLREVAVAGQRVRGVAGGEPGHYQLYAYSSDPLLAWPIDVEVPPAHQSPRPRAVHDANAVVHLDLSPFYNAERLWVTSKWRREEKALDLSRLREPAQGHPAVTRLRTAAGFFLAPMQGPYLALIELGRSEPFLRHTESFGFPASLTIPVNLPAMMLSLLYASEVESRLTGSSVGALRLLYADGRIDEIALAVGKQLDTLYSHWATETIPVEIGHKGDSIHVLNVPCDPHCVLAVFEISLFAADVAIGLIGANILLSHAPPGLAQ